jgi:tetratricopeptide (TPR) repeat protein
VPAFLVGLSALLTVAASTPIRPPAERWRFENSLGTLRQGLKRNEDPNALVALAETALTQVHRFGDRAAEVHFLAGSAYYRQALIYPAALARDAWPRVIEQLEEALQLGVDEEDVAPLQYRLGRALLSLNRDVPRALELMARSADRGAENKLAAYQELADAYLKLAVPDIDAALDASHRVIDLTDEREVDTLAQARLALAELLLRKEQRLDAIRELERIGPPASRPLRTKARLLQVRTCESEGQWAQALAAWQELLADATEVPGGRARVQYGIGWCSAHLERPDFDRAKHAWRDALQLGGEAGQAAGLRLGGLRLFGPKPSVDRGIDAWQRALESTQAPADYRNPFLSLGEARALFDHAIEMLAEEQEYEKMRAVAELYRKLASDGQAELKVAEAAEAQARKRRTDPNTPPTEDLRAHFLDAGECLLRAAQARPGKERADLFGHSFRCFLEANNVDRAAEVLVQLDGLDRDDPRLAEGWYLLAETSQASQQWSKAEQAYHRCMQYATTPFAAQARYQLALNVAEKRNWKQAEEILQPNLLSADLDRDAHEKSLYQMAWIKFQQRDFDRALFFLEQATGRYANGPRVLLARSQIAECHRRLADQAYDKEQAFWKEKANSAFSEEDKLQIDEMIFHQREMRRGRLREAAKVYQALIDELLERQRAHELSDLESLLSRRAMLGLAECCHDQGMYLEALRLYQSLVQKHRARIETLIACERLVQLRDLDAKVDLLAPDGRREVIASARSALILAQSDLANMRPEAADFQGAGVWTWQNWQQWIAAELARSSPTQVLSPKNPGG